MIYSKYPPWWDMKVLHCIVDAVKENDEDAIENLKGAIDKLL